MGATRDSDRVLGRLPSWNMAVQDRDVLILGPCNDASDGYGYVESSVVVTVDDEMERLCNETAC